MTLVELSYVTLGVVSGWLLGHYLSLSWGIAGWLVGGPVGFAVAIAVIEGALRIYYRSRTREPH
jgi:hypothetical protein